MDNYFKKINEYLFSLLNKDEILKTSMWGENSQFIRFNNSKVRQTGLIDDMTFSMILICNNRKSSMSMTLTGAEDKDRSLLDLYLEKLRDNINSLSKRYGKQISDQILKKIDYQNENTLNPVLWDR